MNKKLLIACLIGVAGMTTISCDNKKKATAEAETVEIIDSVKKQAIELFSTVQIENDVLINDIEVLPEGIRVIPVKYFIPLEWAKKAQTLDQKCALIGCYTVDAQFDKLVYGENNNFKERNVAIAELLNSANLVTNAINMDSLASLNREQYIEKTKDFTLKNFEDALSSNNADCHVRVLLYSLIEASLNRQNVFEQRNGYIDNKEILNGLKKGEKAMEGMVKLVEILSPYYSSLTDLLPVTEKIKTVLNAKDETAKDAALLDYDKYVKELRGKLNADFNK